MITISEEERKLQIKLAQMLTIDDMAGVIRAYNEAVNGGIIKSAYTHRQAAVAAKEARQLPTLLAAYRRAMDCKDYDDDFEASFERDLGLLYFDLGDISSSEESFSRMSELRTPHTIEAISDKLALAKMNLLAGNDTLLVCVALAEAHSELLAHPSIQPEDDQLLRDITMWQAVATGRRWDPEFWVWAWRGLVGQKFLNTKVRELKRKRRIALAAMCLAGPFHPLVAHKLLKRA